MFNFLKTFTFIIEEYREQLLIIAQDQANKSYQTEMCFAPHKTLMQMLDEIIENREKALKHYAQLLQPKFDENFNMNAMFSAICSLINVYTSYLDTSEDEYETFDITPLNIIPVPAEQLLVESIQEYENKKMSIDLIEAQNDFLEDFLI